MTFLLLPLVKTNTLVVAIVALIIPLISGYLVDSLTTAAPVAVQDCSCWDVAVSGSTCPRSASTWSISSANFQTYVSIQLDYSKSNILTYNRIVL
jgi:hypothetical protein